MRCVTCNKNLKDHESVRRHGITGEFLDICDGCLRDIPGLPTKMPAGVYAPRLDDGSQDDDTVSTGLEDVTDCYNLDLDKD